MKTIDLCGIARSGKTTTAKSLEKKYPEIIFHPERHDLVPENIKDDSFKYSVWYVNYCVEEFNKAQKINKIHIFERGIIDHIVMGRTYYKMGLFDAKQHKVYSEILNPFISKIDQVIVFIIPVAESVKRASKMGKDVTKAVSYMEKLYKEYKKLPTLHPNVIYLPENATLEELTYLTDKIIF